MTPIKIALAKGYLLEEGVRLFEKTGLRFEDDLTTSRKLMTADTTGQFQIMQVRPWDVQVYVEQGAADLGIVGRDVLVENPAQVLTLKDLKFGYCKLVLAGLEGSDLSLRHHLRIATKYPHATQHYFQSKGLKTQLIKLYGAVELAPLTGLADMICDLTATGKTLKENQLEIVDTVVESSALLIANPVSFKVHHDTITQICHQLESFIGR